MKLERAPKRKKNNNEEKHQITVVEWYKIQYPAFAGCIMAFVNERTKTEGTPLHVWAKYLAKLKRMGMKKGASDLFIAVPQGAYHGLFIEMKDQGKTYCSVSKEQREHIGLMQLMGYRAEWAPGADKAMAIIKEYMTLTSVNHEASNPSTSGQQTPNRSP